MKLKQLFLTALIALVGQSAWADTDVTASYIGDLGAVVNGSHNHESGKDNHKMNNGIGWYNTQALPNGWHAFVGPGTSGTGESWTSGIGGAGVMMGRTIVLPAGQYTLSFEAFGTTASNASDKTAATAGDVVAFCTGQADVDITNTTVGGNAFHNVSFNITVVAPTTTIAFGIKKLTNESKPDWCQIKNVSLTLKSDFEAVPNNSVDGWTREPASPAKGSFEVNTWSTEGQSDGTAFQVPFIQTWVNVNDALLSDVVIKRSYTPANTGIYKVSAWVRPTNQNNEPIFGACMFVGNTKVDVCGSSIGTYTAFVKANAGVPFEYGFEIKDATINWLAFKNVTVEYVGNSEMPGAIVNNDFLNCENGNFPGWTISAPNGGNTWKNGTDNVEYWLENPANGRFDYSQTITGLPLGRYKASARMWNSMNTVPGTFAATSGVYAKSGANTVWGLVDTDCDNNNMVEKETTEIDVVNGTLQIGVANKETMVARWFGVDWIKLTYVGALSFDVYRNAIADLLSQADAITGAHTASLAQALSDAKNATSGYETSEDADALQGMIDGLTVAIQNSRASVEAYAALKTELDKTYLNDRSTAFGTSFTYRTEAQSMYDNATTATGAVKVKASGLFNAYRAYIRGIAAAHPQVLTVKAARESSAWEYTTNPNPNNNKALNNAVNADVAANSLWENWKGGGLDNGDMKQTVTGLPNGTYFLRMASFTRNSINANDYIYIKSGSTTKTAVSLGDATSSNAFSNITDPIQVTNGEVEIGLHVGSGADWAAIGGVELHAMSVANYARSTASENYGTICLPHAATVTGAEVYSAAIDGDVVKLTEIDNLVAGTPYIYKATADAQNFVYASGNLVAVQAAAPLVGSYTRQLIDKNADNYILYDGKFYLVNSEAYVGAYKAYLHRESDGGDPARELTIGGEETAIEALNAIIENKAEIYDLNGRRLNSLQKGINIVNGVKVLVK